MRDGTRYKYAYSGEWSTAVRRERLIANILTDLGFDPELDGFGAGGEEFIEGLAVENGQETAAPDIYLNGTNTLIEVTGTNKGNVRPENRIWVRPDKLEYANKHPEQNVWVVHVLDGPALIRAIHLTEDVINEFSDADESTNTFHADNEDYVKIQPSNEHIQSVYALLDALDAPTTRRWGEVLTHAFAQWATINDINNDNEWFSIALRVDEVDRVLSEKDSVPDAFIRTTDRDGDSVDLLVWPDTAFDYTTLDTGSWYFFRDLKTGTYKREPQLKAQDETNTVLIDDTVVEH